MLDAKSKGEKTEAIVLAELVKRDVTVLTPFGENQRYDFVVEVDGKFYRLQCKTARDEGDTVVFSTRSTRPRGTGYSTADYGGEVEYFIAHCHDREQSYLVPLSAASKNEMVLRTELPKNNQSKGINWAQDYDLDDGLRRMRGT